jgi:DNA-directed RNA polymerase subunit N (RpoN/RPB10)
MDTVYPHVACFTCGKRIGAYDKTIQRLTSKPISFEEAIGIVGWSSYLPELRDLIGQGLTEQQAMEQLGLDYSRVEKLVNNVSLREALKIYHLDKYYPQIESLMNRGLTARDAMAKLGLEYEPIGRLLKGGLTIAQAMDLLGITRTCCRTNIMSPGVIPLGAGTVVKEQQPIARVTAPIQSIVTQTPQRSISTRTTPSPISSQLPPRLTRPTLPPKLGTPSPIGGRRLY